ncbi:lysM and putative peptidoglycan-binding domain-containing protein 1 [Brienomyrus brachyistius]|uniref:lysM and putative peptidoglycan-binding domain-containing protein 1 n=1 Tax=Brienomyrus brachyistius TaxID=42636 RepID=UPI0020B31318|nr:lysM and putative peptidoglycan-binding domain-containing protein 1 [Brienomyrus brachyistius]XP_048880390.1 lysM and putative peptidoglycan-binding domain-containing protein 1 [Brienomyrus brachyistius]XP_048880391.1 lysM and putative peptidoglycan-binding domain-containing protein 1 [Brienomyrus brachyistius]
MSSESGAKRRPEASRTRSYGSLAHSPVSPVRLRQIQHHVQPGETLQGLALKYGVSMEQIKRANRLYTNDPVCLKKSISIPVLADFDAFTNGGSADEEMDQSCSNKRKEGQAKHRKPADVKEEERVRPPESPELSPMDFLKRMDAQISQSKMAAVKKIREGQREFACIEDSHPYGASSYPATGNADAACCTANQRAMLGAVPLTITKRATVLKDHEDEIFEL